MSLATRCPACGTIFRVVQDQLKVSEGWVRCGQCHEVFHGIEALFDLDSDPAIAARRAARGNPAPSAPSTRVFADKRASAPIPQSEPPGGIVVPSPPPAPVRPPQATTTPPSGFTPASGTMARPPSPPPATRGIAPRFAARLAEESARAQASPPSSPIPSPFPESHVGPSTWPSTDVAPLPPSRDGTPLWLPSQPAPAPTAPEPTAPEPASTPPAVASPPTIWASPTAWQPSAPVPEAAPARAPAATPIPTAVFQPVAAPQPAPTPVAPVAPIAFTPPAAPTPAPAPAPAQSVVPPPEVTPGAFASPPSWQRAEPAPVSRPATIWETPPGAPMPERPSFNAPTEAMPLDGLPEPFEAEMPIATPEPAPTPADLADSFAAPPTPAPARQPRTVTGRAAEPAPAPTPSPSPAPRVAARDVGGSTLPSMLADDAADDENRAGPPTLASMLPEDAGEWPPRKKSRKAKAAEKDELESVAAKRASDPRFLREAKSDARWRKPWVRAVLGVSLAVLVVTAAGQLAWPLRDTLAARWPATLPAWTWLCEQADCRIEPPRSIASLALDGSSLNRTDTEHVLLFSADLHNRTDHEVRMPSFDLTFTDINGAIVSRKVLSPEQIGIHLAALAPDADLHVHARIQVGTLDASGFQAEMFYP